MSAIAPDPSVRVRPLVESRPPSRHWRLPETDPIAANQPPLDLIGRVQGDLGPPSGREVGSTVVRAGWAVRPRRDLPNAGEWGAVLTLAVVQTLLSQRPIAQLNRWLADDVLSMVSIQQRRRQLQPGRAVRPVVVRSIRVQHPAVDVTEGSAHVVVGIRDTALAFRLEALGERWLCTALEFDPRMLR